ncbi:hypothetical protein MKZ38_004909 [Zalerion maritima]|uniref:2EXR domain-containing protein n=1 Tax=Zalerion maritima TaxID=339359 RepID=A0AAD5S461_9PEZI|nr:hypothetical protein MKZ38_004909 [Zalerion maritima]
MSCSPPLPSPPSFSRFPNLPFELREEIWKLSLEPEQQGRHWYNNSVRYAHNLCLLYKVDFSRGIGPPDSLDEFEVAADRDRLLQSTEPSRVLLSTCRDSRNAVKRAMPAEVRLYRRDAEGGRPTNGIVRFHPVWDQVVLSTHIGDMTHFQKLLRQCPDKDVLTKRFGLPTTSRRFGLEPTNDMGLTVVGDEVYIGEKWISWMPAWWGNPSSSNEQKDKKPQLRLPLCYIVLAHMCPQECGKGKEIREFVRRSPRGVRIDSLQSLLKLSISVYLKNIGQRLPWEGQYTADKPEVLCGECGLPYDADIMEQWMNKSSWMYWGVGPQ